MAAHFNSQPHEEADVLFRWFRPRFSISTHSLTKRLTIWHGSKQSRIYISTHSLTKRLTSCKLPTNTSKWHFNSQPHEEADRRGGKWRSCTQHFNSQPHEEADFGTMFVLRFLKYFNSQPHEEADERNEKKCTNRSIFQLTASRRG